MAAAIPPRSLLVSLSLSCSKRFLLTADRLHLHCFPRQPIFSVSLKCKRPSSTGNFHPSPSLLQRSLRGSFFSTESMSSNSNSSSTNTNTNSTAAFDWSDEDDDVDGGKTKKSKEIDTSKLPPPYDPFSKKPVVEEPRDPSDLQEIFHKMRTEGLTNHAIKMFDALSKDGLTHQALELFAVIKDKGAMPDVVAHTAVIEAYSNAGGHSKEAIRTFERMLSSGVSPNAYTYAVLIRGLARDARLSDARRFLLEMMGKGMRPNAPTYLAVFESFVREQRLHDAASLLEEMREKGFVADERAVRDLLPKRGQLFRTIMTLLFGKN